MDELFEEEFDDELFELLLDELELEFDDEFDELFELELDDEFELELDELLLATMMAPSELAVRSIAFVVPRGSPGAVLASAPPAASAVMPTLTVEASSQFLFIAWFPYPIGVVPGWKTDGAHGYSSRMKKGPPCGRPSRSRLRRVPRDQNPICLRPTSVRSACVARPLKSTSKFIGAKSGGDLPARNAAFCPGRYARFLAQSGAEPM